MELIFDWDVEKDRKNIKKHKIAFEEEKTIGGITYQVINLYPTKDQDKPYHTAKITVDKKKGRGWRRGWE